MLLCVCSVIKENSLLFTLLLFLGVFQAKLE